MAIAFVASVDGGNNGGGSASHTFAVNATGGDFLVVGAFHNGTTEDSMAATYNGVSMTEVNAGIGAAGVGYVKLFYLANPTSGSNNVVISKTGNAFIAGMTSLYSGVNSTGQPDAQTTNSATGTTGITTNLTTIANNCWTILWSANSAGLPVAGTGSTVRQASANGYGLFDSNGPVTPAGSYNMQITGASANWRTIMASFSPSGGVKLFNLLGVGV